MSWNDTNTKAKITKIILAMSNIRDGGYLVLGFNQDGDTFVPTGVVQSDLSSFNYDHVRSHVAEYADPYVEFSMEIVKDEEQKKSFLVFTVKEFAEIPVICAKNGLENLEEGAVYTRSRRIPESVKVPTQSEMREIVDMAIEKGLRKYIETSRRAGLEIQATTKEDEYDEELEGIL
jgi:hypothetical protein